MISVLYGAIVTIRQTDLKRLIAYSSVSHMGLVMLGVAVAIKGFSHSAEALAGAGMQMFAHGTITGLLFLLVGLVYEKAHTRYIPDLGGLATRMPFIATVFLIAGLASLGLPGLSGFVAEVLVFLWLLQYFCLAHGPGRFRHCPGGGLYIVDDRAGLLWRGQRTLRPDN